MTIRTILVDDEPLATQGLQLRLQAQLQALSRQGFVVDQNGPDGHQALSPVS